MLNKSIGVLSKSETQKFIERCVFYKRKNWKVEYNRIKKALSLFNVVIEKLTVDEIIAYLDHKMTRHKRLKSEGKSPSIVDLEYYKIFAPNEASAILYWNKINSKKSLITSLNNKNNPDRAKAATLEWQITKYGVEEGTKRYNEFNQRKLEKNSTRLEYWIKKGFSIDEAIQKQKERQTTFSMQKCIEKYGHEKGKLVFEARQKKWQNTLKQKPEEEKILISIKKNIFCLEGYLLRGYSLKEAENILEQRIQNSNNSFTSKESIVFFEENFNYCDWLYGKGKEWFIWDPYTSRHYFYDFVHLKSKTILEYHGSAWHPNIKNMTEKEKLTWQHAKTKQSCIVRNAFDQYKKQVAEKSGFKVFEIFSNDTIEQKQLIINEIKNATN